MLSVEQVLAATEGKLLQGGHKPFIKHVGIDSRKMKRGSLFIAIKGTRLDGHQFIGQAISSGAQFLVVSRKVKAPPGVTVIWVADTTKALGFIAGAYRQQFKIPIIAITGSTGKTTTKEMIASVLGSSYKVLKNIKTENNHFGVPLTLLRLTRGHEVAVVEFGTNQPGDIAWLARITEPTIAVFTNIGEAHLKGLKSRAGIFREKTSLIKFMRNKGKVIVNIDDNYLKKLKKTRLPRTLVTFGIKEPARFRAKRVQMKNNRTGFVVQEQEFTINSFAVHNVYNCLAAISCGSLLGIPYNKISRRLRSFKFPQGRFAVKRTGSIRIIDDTYNANPLSMRCAVEALSHMPGHPRRIVVCADMLELGERSDELHEKLGYWMALQNIDHVFSYGRKAKLIVQAFSHKRGNTRSKDFHDMDALNEHLKRFCVNGDMILIKGSRSMKMERVVDYLLNTF